MKIIIKEENFKWHLEAFASELFTCSIICKPMLLQLCIHAFM